MNRETKDDPPKADATGVHRSDEAGSIKEKQNK